jgi:sulfur-oxidizing protein SoxA
MKLLCPLAAIILAFGAATVLAGTNPLPPKSGYDFLTPENQALQDDDFANPGMLWVETGARLWAESCASCHAEGSMRGVAARYPQWDEKLGRVINLEQRINDERKTRLDLEPLAYESEDLLGLTAWIGNQSKGLPIDVKVDGPAAGSFERGRDFFYTRRGQLDLSCASCHEQHVGDHLRAETISQGQINGFPIYRVLWQTMGSTHRMFAWCNQAVRAEPYPAGSQEYVDLELFERWRGMGLTVETPAVRR